MKFNFFLSISIGGKYVGTSLLIINTKERQRWGTSRSIYFLQMTRVDHKSRSTRLGQTNSFIFQWTIWKVENDNVENLIKIRNLIKLTHINFWQKFWINAKNILFLIFFLKSKNFAFSNMKHCFQEEWNK